MSDTKTKKTRHRKRTKQKKLLSKNNKSNFELSKSVALVGMMGVGKTTVGRRLSAKLDLPFYDSDDEIETASGRSVAGYFADYGEQAFRDGERKVIERLLSGPPILLATGGGAFVQDETRAIIQEHAITIWLKADFNVIMKRVSRNSERPLLNVENPEEVIKKLIDQRYPIYDLADITVNANRGPHLRTVTQAIKALKNYHALAQDAKLA